MHTFVRGTFYWGLPGDYRFDFPFGDYSFLEEAYVSGHDAGSMSLQSLMMSSNRGLVLGIDQGTHHRALFDVVAGAYAYHLDNKKLIAFLKEEAREAGVEHIDAVISDITLSQNHEEIECLLTSDRKALKFDLYVDCSGFRSLLLEKALGSRFVSYEKSLLADAAIVADVPHDGSIRPYTSAESMKNGSIRVSQRPLADAVT